MSELANVKLWLKFSDYTYQPHEKEFEITLTPTDALSLPQLATKFQRDFADILHRVAPRVGSYRLSITWEDEYRQSQPLLELHGDLKGVLFQFAKLKGYAIKEIA